MHDRFVCRSRIIEIYSFWICANAMNAGIGWHPIVMHPAGNASNISFKSRDSMIKIEVNECPIG